MIYIKPFYSEKIYKISCNKKIKIWSYSKRINSINLICEIEMICFWKLHSRNCVWHFFSKRGIIMGFGWLHQKRKLLKKFNIWRYVKNIHFYIFFVYPGWIQILILPWIIPALFILNLITYWKSELTVDWKYFFVLCFSFHKLPRCAYYSLNHIIDNRKI